MTNVVPAPGADVRRLTSVRRVASARMQESWRTIPAVTLHRTVRLAPLFDARDRAAAHGRKPSVDVLLAILAARALAKHPLLNGSWVEEQRAVVVHPFRNVAVAVDTARGLIPVVLRSADTRTAGELDADFFEMVERARSGRSRPDDLAQPTFTITNLGALGIELFTPIITLPQVAVLGIGAARAVPSSERPAVVSLTFDHRVVDGAEGARFLALFASTLNDVTLQ